MAGSVSKVFQRTCNDHIKLRNIFFKLNIVTTYCNVFFLLHDDYIYLPNGFTVLVSLPAYILTFGVKRERCLSCVLSLINGV